VAPLRRRAGAPDPGRADHDAPHAARDAFAALKYDVLYREHAEGGHDWAIEGDEDVLAWLEKRRRTPYPEGVVFKTCEEARELRVWLDDAMVDLEKPVTVTVNGKKLHDAVVRRSVETLVEEARRRRDRSMTFSAYVDVRPR
jgi:hypothetical protein